MTYALIKLLHIASVVIFLGNITTGLFWAHHAHRSRDFALVATTFDGIIRSDRWFTVPGVVGILVSGVVMAHMAQLPILGTSWILWPLALFAVSGVIFSIWLAPLQRKICNGVRGDVAPELAWLEYAALYRRWELLGLAALLTPVLALAIMVVRPPLPGL